MVTLSRMKRKYLKGFSLVELMIVIAIIGLLSVVLIPKIGKSKDAVKDAGVLANVRAIQAELELMNIGAYTLVTQADHDRLYADIVQRVTNLDLTNPYSGSTLVTTNNQPAFVASVYTRWLGDTRDRAGFDTDYMQSGFWDYYVPGGIFIIPYYNAGKFEIGLYDMGRNGPISPLAKVVRVIQ